MAARRERRTAAARDGAGKKRAASDKAAAIRCDRSAPRAAARRSPPRRRALAPAMPRRRQVCKALRQKFRCILNDLRPQLIGDFAARSGGQSSSFRPGWNDESRIPGRSGEMIRRPRSRAAASVSSRHGAGTWPAVTEENRLAGFHSVFARGDGSATRFVRANDFVGSDEIRVSWSGCDWPRADARARYAPPRSRCRSFPIARAMLRAVSSRAF